MIKVSLRNPADPGRPFSRCAFWSNASFFPYSIVYNSSPPDINQMSASTSKAGEPSKPAEQKTQENLPNLGVLEEDDEFEEFAVAG